MPSRPLLPGLGPVGPPPRLGEALAEVGELGFGVADGVLQVAFGRGGGFEVAVGVGHGPFGLLDLLLATGLALGRLAARWDGIVGARLAAETTPMRLERGVLTIAASTQPWAAQVRFLGREIAVRASTQTAPVREIRVFVPAGKGAP